MRPICVKCGEVMDVKKNGVAVIGRKHNMLRYGDRYACQQCDTEIVTGFGEAIYSKEVVKDFEEGIDKIRKRVEELVIIDE